MKNKIVVVMVVKVVKDIVKVVKVVSWMLVMMYVVKVMNVVNDSGVTEMNVFVGLKIKFEKVLSQFPKRRLQQASSVDAQLFKAIQSYAKQ